MKLTKQQHSLILCTMGWIFKKLTKQQHSSILCTMGWIFMKSTYSIHEHFYSMSLGVCEQLSNIMNEHSGAHERSEQCGAREWLSGLNKRGSGGTNGPVHSATISYHFEPTRDIGREPKQKVCLFFRVQAKSSMLQIWGHDLIRGFVGLSSGVISGS